MAVRGEPPAFAFVRKFFFQVESSEVVNEGFVILPGELKEFAVQSGEAFSEVFRSDIDFFQDASGFEINFAE